MKIMESKGTGRVIVAIREFIDHEENRLLCIEIHTPIDRHKTMGITSWRKGFFKEIGGTNGLSEDNGI